MRGGRLKEIIAASTIEKPVVSAESLSSLFVTSLKESGSSSSDGDGGGGKIATWKRTILSGRLSGKFPGISDLGPSCKNSEFPGSVPSKVLSVLKQARAGGVSEDKSPVDVVFHVTSALRGDSESLKVGRSRGTDKGCCTVLENCGARDTHNIFKLQMQRERNRERKAKWTLKNSHNIRFSRLIKKSAEVLGTENTLEVLSKLGKETGVKEYSALIDLCIEKAREASDVNDSLIRVQKAFHLFGSMKEKGFKIEEESYRPLLMYLIDMGLIEEFHSLIDILKDESHQANPRVSYYEMMLWIKSRNEEKIVECFHSIIANGSISDMRIAENYLLAFCVGDRKEEMLQLLNFLDVRHVSSMEYLSVIFQTLGKLSLENLAMDSFSSLKGGDVAESDISLLILDYTSKMPNLSVEEVVSKFIGLHRKVGLEPASRSYEKLIAYCCNLFKICTTLDPLVQGRGQICRLDWVREVCSEARRHGVQLEKESFRSMMNLYIMIKDFEGAYNLLAELKGTGMEIDTSLYNAVMIGCFKEKNICGGLKVLKEMKNADVKPDSETFSYLIFNCNREEDINNCLDEMKHCQADFTKHTYIALINAYTNSGKFSRAKEVIMDKWIPVDHINEIKSALIIALSSKGRITEALEIYDTMKESGCWVEPKAVVTIIEFYRSKGQIKRLLQLLADLDNSSLWSDACGRVIHYCIKNDLLRSAVDLLQTMKVKDEEGMSAVIDQAFCQIWESEPKNMEIGMGLLSAMKNELGLLPSRASLDFLLSTCLKVKDLKASKTIWAEYSKAGLPFNVLSYLRMYHALMAGGDFSAAEKISKIIPCGDKHVRSIMKACRVTYMRDDDLIQ
ncbi:pentatricopeptide repeat-containing protein At4g04790, mitochondrial-like [Wolffia australiana]